MATDGSSSRGSPAERKQKAEEKTRVRVRRPGWLPDGWYMDFSVDGDENRVTYYRSPISGNKFRTQEEVLHYLKVTVIDRYESCTASFSENNSQNVVPQIQDPPEWLPEGWILEIKSRLSGEAAEENYKCYFDPFTGSRFYSKAEVVRFLKSEKHYSPTSSEKERRRASAKDNVLALIEFSPEGLPKGWTKETTFRKSKDDRIIKDKYYADPLKQHIFRTFKDVAHYVNTGEVGKRVLGPRRTSICETYAIKRESPPPIPLKELRSLGPTAKRRLFAKEAPSNRDKVTEIKDSPHHLDVSPLGFPPLKSKQKVNLSSCSHTEHSNLEAVKKRKAVPESTGATSEPVVKRKRGRPPKKKKPMPSMQSKEIENESEEFLELTKNTQKPVEEEKEALLGPLDTSEKSLESNKNKNKESLESENITETPLESRNEIKKPSRGRKRKEFKVEAASLPRRSSKRLAEAALAPDLILRRSGDASSKTKEPLPLLEPQIVDVEEEAVHEKQVNFTGNVSKKRLLSPVKHFVSTGNTFEDGSSVIYLPYGDSWPVPCTELAVEEEAFHEKRVEITGTPSEDKLPFPEKQIVEPEMMSKDMPLSPEKHAIGTENISEERPLSPVKQLVSTGNTFEDGSLSVIYLPFGDSWPDPCIELAVEEEAFHEKRVEITGNASEDRLLSPKKQIVEPVNTSKDMQSSPEKHVIVTKSTSEEKPPSPVKQFISTGNASEDGSSSVVALPFGEARPDPCIEFTMKSLITEFPLLDGGVAIEEFVENQIDVTAKVIALDNQGTEQAEALGAVEKPADSAQEKRAEENELPSDGKEPGVQG